MLRKIRLFLLRLLDRRWGRLIALLEQHEDCCGYAALDAIKTVDWTSTQFNRALEQAYTVTDSRGCNCYGWQRRMMLYGWSMKYANFTLGENAKSGPVLAKEVYDEC